jgi:Flp pilus assembly pilin Flp
MVEMFKALVERLQAQQKGQDLTEYALLVAVIALVVVLAAIFFGTALSSWFVNISAAIPLT